MAEVNKEAKKTDTQNIMTVLSMDIGGANTKFSLLSFNASDYLAQLKNLEYIKYADILDKSEILFYTTEYFPFWNREKGEFIEGLKKIKKEVLTELQNKGLSGDNLHIVVTITAELSDAFYTKEEGIIFICNSLKKIFPKDRISIINVHGRFLSVDDALSDYLSVSASNWIATSLVFGENEKLGLLLDMGSTTLDLIPIKDGFPMTIGTNDTDRLLNYELFYTGVLRPPVSSVVQSVPLRNARCPVSFERFALMADVYLILGKITEKEYTCDTADGRGKSLEESYARLARIVCSDINLMDRSELDEIAIYIYNTHKSMVKEAISKALDSFTHRFVMPISKIRFNLTGLGANILLKPILLEMGINPKQIFFKGLDESQHVVSTAICLGIVFLKDQLEKML